MSIAIDTFWCDFIWYNMYNEIIISQIQYDLMSVKDLNLFFSNLALPYNDKN